MRFNPWQGLGNQPAGMWIVFAASLINRAGTMALPFLVLYLTQDIGLTPSRAGLAMLSYGLGSLVAGPIAGWLCDRVGTLPVIQSSLILSGLLLAIFPLARSDNLVLVIPFLWAFVGEAYRPASSVLISSLVSPDQRKAAYALYRLAINLGMSIGPLLGGLLVTHASYRWLFWIDGVTSVLAGLVFFAAYGFGVTSRVPEAAQSAISAENRGPRARRFEWADPRLLLYMAAIFPVALVFFQFEGAMPVFIVRELGLSEAVYGGLFLVNTILIVFCELPLNLATSGWPHHRSLALGALLTGIGFGALAMVTGVMGLAATIVIWTCGEMILMPASASYVADISPPARRGRYMGVYHVTFSLAFSIGPWLGVALFDRFGGRAVWLIALAVGCLSAALLWLVTRPAAVERTCEEQPSPA